MGEGDRKTKPTTCPNPEMEEKAESFPEGKSYSDCNGPRSLANSSRLYLLTWPSSPEVPLKAFPTVSRSGARAWEPLQRSSSRFLWEPHGQESVRGQGVLLFLATRING